MILAILDIFCLNSMEMILVPTDLTSLLVASNLALLPDCKLRQLCICKEWFSLGQR